MTRRDTQQNLTECLYALLAYASAVTILCIGGYILCRTARDGLLSAPWQVVLMVMVIPLLAATAVSCGNYRENRAVRAVTWVILVPLGVVNPVAWIGALVIIARVYRRAAIGQHAAGD